LGITRQGPKRLRCLSLSDRCIQPMPGIRRNTFVNHRIIRFCCRVGLGTRLPASIIRLVRCGSVFSRLSVNAQPRRLSAFCCLPCRPILPHHERMCNTTPRIQFDRDEPCYFALFTHRGVSARRNAIVMLVWRGMSDRRLPSSLVSNPCVSAASISYYKPQKLYSS
jgi:hypothetical protein